MPRKMTKKRLAALLPLLLKAESVLIDDREARSRRYRMYPHAHIYGTNEYGSRGVRLETITYAELGELIARSLLREYTPDECQQGLIAGAHHVNRVQVITHLHFIEMGKWEAEAAGALSTLMGREQEPLVVTGQGKLPHP